MRKAFHFTLLEILISVGVLSFFLYYCSSVLISTLMMKQELEKKYEVSRVKSIGWHVIYQDLANALGIHYLDGTLWDGSSFIKTPKGKKNTKVNRKLRRSAANDLLFEFDGEGGEESFLNLVVAQGRHRMKDKDLGFRKVRYYLMPHPEKDSQIILRTEEPWHPTQKKSSNFEDSNAESDLLSDYQRYTVLEDVANVEFTVYNGEEWKDEWNSINKKELPLALRITCDIVKEKDEFAEPRHDEEKFVRIIPIPISNLPVKEPLEELLLAQP